MVAESPAAADGLSIFTHTRSAVTSAQYPSRLDYTIVVSELDGEVPVTDHYRASFEPADSRITPFCSTGGRRVNADALYAIMRTRKALKPKGGGVRAKG